MKTRKEKIIERIAGGIILLLIVFAYYTGVL